MHTRANDQSEARAYPKATTTDSARAQRPSVPLALRQAQGRGAPRPRFPGARGAGAGLWRADDTFRGSVARNPAGEDGDNESVFYDGPPFANGLPHYGHLLTGYVKDVVPRFQTMRGTRVERRFGWDCHGLPAELETTSSSG